MGGGVIFLSLRSLIMKLGVLSLLVVSACAQYDYNYASFSDGFCANYLTNVYPNPTTAISVNTCLAYRYVTGKGVADVNSPIFYHLKFLTGAPAGSVKVGVYSIDDSTCLNSLSEANVETDKCVTVKGNSVVVYKTINFSGAPTHWSNSGFALASLVVAVLF